MSQPVAPLREATLASLSTIRTRNLRALTDTLNELEPDDHVAATIRSPFYGLFIVRGRVVRSCATDRLLVGGQHLGTTGRARKPLPELLALAPAEDGPNDIADEMCVADIAHGDIIAANFNQHPYGRFSVTGFTVHAPAAADALITGGWYLTGRELRTAAPRLLALRLIADAQSHELPIPARITRWPEPDTNSH
ncbi:hypothetical protein ACQPZ2_01020 [Nocardia pseudovaccinii]|uniref:hypothetical protein n=1 Tax=Nocardia pseudovaccinii TaxID=189540 RepID=UPI003D8F43F9